MASANALPFLVVERILYHAIGNTNFIANTWKSHLRLLALCQQWRAVGKTLLYKHVFFFTKRMPEQTSFAVNPARAHIDGLDPQVVASNVGLAAQMGALKYARCFRVVIRELVHVNWLFSAIILSHRDFPAFWPNIQKLYISSYIYDNGLSDADKALFRDSTAESVDTRLALTARLMRMAIPNVKVAYLAGIEGSVLIRPLLDCLAAEYSPKITRLYYSAAASANICSASFSDSLTHLELNLDIGAKNVLPRIPSQQLQHLRLTDANENFSWKHFQPENACSDIVFANLKSLDISYSPNSFFEKPEEFAGHWRYQASSEPLKVHFPKLESLYLSSPCIESDASLFDVFPSKIRKLTYRPCLSDLRDYENCSIKSVDYLVCSYRNFDEGFVDGFYEESGYFFNQVEVNKYSSLSIRNTIPLEVDRVQWSNLQDLQVGIIDLASLFQLLQRLQNIICLDVLELDSDAFDFTSDLYDWDMSKSLLGTCAFRRKKPSSSHSEFLSACEFFLRTMKSVKGFAVCPSFESDLRAAIERCDCLLFPHLKDIRICHGYDRYNEHGRLIIY